MSAEVPAVEAATIERFDKAVVRLVGRVTADLAQVVPEDQTIVFTVSAPIRLPAKTAAALESMVRSGLPERELRSIVHGNQVQVRRVTGVPSSMPRVVGFVHNPESDAGLILDLARSRLLERR